MENKKYLIDVDRLIKDANTKYYGAEFVMASLRLLIDKQPIVDAVEVVHGRWIEKWHDNAYGGFPLFHCSECDTPNAQKRNYCHNCGAKMDGEVSE